MDILHRASTGTHDITVCDTHELFGERGRFRVLQFGDGAVQGAIDLDDPQRIVLEYPRAIIHLMEANKARFRDVFAIGHGIGTIPGHYAIEEADIRFKSAELDGAVAELSRRYFGYRGGPILIGDGRQLLEDEPDEAHDYVIVDAFTDKGVPQQLCSLSFFSLAYAKLGEDGSILLNLFGRGGNDPLVCSVHTTLGMRFAYTRAFSLPGRGAADLRNIVLMGSRRPIRYQARRLAGFAEVELPPGHVLDR